MEQIGANCKKKNEPDKDECSWEKLIINIWWANDMFVLRRFIAVLISSEVFSGISQEGRRRIFLPGNNQRC